MWKLRKINKNHQDSSGNMEYLGNGFEFCNTVKTTNETLGISVHRFFYHVQNFKSFICSPNGNTKFKAVAEILHVS